MVDWNTTLGDIHTALLKKRLPFVVSFGLIFIFSYGFLYSAGLVPESVDVSDSDTNSSLEIGVEDPSNAAVASLGPTDDRPQRIIIDAIGVDATIVNPVSQNISVLDDALREGVVHYPGSGDLEDFSNLFLFAHSSFLPNVQNEWYRVFNNLSKLSSGDVIRVQANGYEYRYVVSSVELVDASEALVELSNREKKLTLSTCNSFGAASERFVVEAEYLGRTELGSGARTAV